MTEEWLRHVSGLGSYAASVSAQTLSAKGNSSKRHISSIKRNSCLGKANDEENKE